MLTTNIHHVIGVDQQTTRHESGAVWTTLMVEFLNNEGSKCDFEIVFFADESLAIGGRIQPVPFTIRQQRTA